MILQGGIYVKCKIEIDVNCEEEVIVRTKRITPLVKEIKRLCKEETFHLIGYQNGEGFRLTPAKICCFVVEDNKIWAITTDAKLQVKCRLYQLEEQLPENFIKINQSCIANINMIERFDASIGGTLTVKFKNGYTDWVSRRNLKHVKERLGLSK